MFTNKYDFEYFHNLINNNLHFIYSRFNDGEMIAISNKVPNGTNCDGHMYFTSMGNELKNCLLNYDGEENYYIQSFQQWYNSNFVVRNIINELHRENNKLNFIDKDWIRITHEQEPDKFIQLLNLLKTKKIVIIGADYLTELSRFFEFKQIFIDRKNCYNNKNRVIQEIKELNREDSGHIYLFSASMATNVIIDEFKNDDKNTYIDWGSVWDTFFVSSDYSFIRKRSTSSYEKYKIIYKDYLI